MANVHKRGKRSLWDCKCNLIFFPVCGNLGQQQGNILNVINDPFSHCVTVFVTSLACSKSKIEMLEQVEKYV